MFAFRRILAGAVVGASRWSVPRFETDSAMESPLRGEIGRISGLHQAPRSRHARTAAPRRKG